MLQFSLHDNRCIANIDVYHILLKQPWRNGRCERFHLTIKAEILERVDILSVQHARELCFGYQVHYNYSRPHQAIGGRAPDMKINPALDNSCPVTFSYMKKTVIGGLITEFSLAT
jgi:transposase InsO family protein